MKRNTLRIYGCARHFARHYKKWLLKGLVFTLVFLSALMSLRAEIYKWQDETGTTRYSNKPPAEQTPVPEQPAPPAARPGENPAGTAYYLNLPDEQADKNSAPAAIPPRPAPADVLHTLKQPAPTLVPGAQTPLDITALTIRLAEVEKALTHETAQRMQKEQESAQTQALLKQLQNQNSTLKLAFTQMENDLKDVRGTVAVADGRLTALKDAPPPQQLAMLASKVDDLQGHLNALTEATRMMPQDKKSATFDARFAALESKLGALNDAAVSEKFTALANNLHQLELQQQPEYDLRVKLASLETTVSQLTDALPTAHGTEIVAKLVENGNMLKTVTEYQTRQITDQQTQLETLRAEIEQLKAQPSATPAVKSMAHNVAAEMPVSQASAEDATAMIAGLVEKNTFMEAVIKHQANVLKAQNEHLKEIEAKLAQLQSPAQPLQGQAVVTSSADFLPQEDELAAPANGIKIVERKARREAPRGILSWLIK